MRGLVWEAYGNGELQITRLIVEGRVGKCKTKAGRSAVPLLAYLARAFDACRESNGNPATGPIFGTSGGTLIGPNNTLQWGSFRF